MPCLGAVHYGSCSVSGLSAIYWQTINSRHVKLSCGPNIIGSQARCGPRVSSLTYLIYIVHDKLKNKLLLTFLYNRKYNCVSVRPPKHWFKVPAEGAFGCLYMCRTWPSLVGIRAQIYLTLIWLSDKDLMSERFLFRCWKNKWVCDSQDSEVFESGEVCLADHCQVVSI